MLVLLNISNDEFSYRIEYRILREVVAVGRLL